MVSNDVIDAWASLFLGESNDETAAVFEQRSWSDNVQLLVVKNDEFPNMPLASVSDVESNTEWQQQMGHIAVAALADGEAFGEGRNFDIEQCDDLFVERHLGYKIIAVPINDLHQLGKGL